MGSRNWPRARVGTVTAFIGATGVAVLAVMAWPLASLGAEPEGRAVFERDCRPCHTVVRLRNHVGPSLFGVVGRTVGSISSFVYSGALRGSVLIWSESFLDRFLRDPQAVLPGTAMRFPGLSDAGERAALIAYLKGL